MISEQHYNQFNQYKIIIDFAIKDKFVPRNCGNDIIDLANILKSATGKQTDTGCTGCVAEMFATIHLLMKEYEVINSAIDLVKQRNNV